MFFLLDVFFRPSVVTVLGNIRCTFLVFPELIVFPFLFESSFEQTSSFVSLILRGYSEGCCRNLSQYRDRLECNSHSRGSSSLLSHLISFSNVLTSINCLLNCYSVEKLIDSPYYPPLEFEFLGRNKYSCFV